MCLKAQKFNSSVNKKRSHFIIYFIILPRNRNDSILDREKYITSEILVLYLRKHCEKKDVAATERSERNGPRR